MLVVVMVKRGGNGGNGDYGVHGYSSNDAGDDHHDGDGLVRSVLGFQLL